MTRKSRQRRRPSRSRSRSSKSSAAPATKPAFAKRSAKPTSKRAASATTAKRTRSVDLTRPPRSHAEVVAQNQAIREKSKRRISRFLAGMEPPPDPYARKLQLPKLANGRQPGSDMAMDDAGGLGPFPYLGYMGGLNSLSLYFPGYPYLAMLSQRSEYLSPTHTHAKDMTREWIEFTTKGKSDKSKKIEEIESRFTDLDIQGLFRKALIHDGFYGVGHIFVDLKEHRDTKLPVELDSRSISKGQLKGFRNIEPMWVTPVMWNANRVELDSFYVPDTWWALDKEMNKTRLLQVSSREVPDILKPAYNFGGFSLSQLIEPYVDRWLKTVGGVNRLINNFSLIVLKTDMSAVLQDDGNDPTGANLLQRLQMARRHGDNTGAFAVDFAKEELEQLAVPLSGLAELQQQAVDHMAYPTHIPLVVLTGVTPSGLNASSDGEIEVYHDWNRSEQNAVIRKPLKYVLDVVQLDMYGKIDPDIGFEFKPIKQITGSALAEIQKTGTERDVALIDAGVVSKEEVREKTARDKNSGFINLDVDRMPELPDEEEGKVEPGEEIGGKPAGELVREAA